MRVLISYRSIPQSPGWATGDMLAWAFESLGHQVFRYAKIYNENKWLEDPRVLIKEKYDLLICLECGDPDKVYWELGIVDAKIKVTWGFDIILYPEKWLEIIESLDKSSFNFLANPDLLDRFPNSVFLPYAADDKLHYRPLTFAKQYDFALVGLDRPERRDLINKLKVEGLDAHLITNIFREEYINALASAKVVINDEAGGGKSLRSMRYYESQMSGAVLLTPYQVSNRQFSQEENGIFEYIHTNHLIALCKDLINNPNKILEIAKYRQEYILKNDSYKNRAQKILEVCGFD